MADEAAEEALEAAAEVLPEEEEGALELVEDEEDLVDIVGFNNTGRKPRRRRRRPQPAGGGAGGWPNSAGSWRDKPAARATREHAETACLRRRSQQAAALHPAGWQRREACRGLPAAASEAPWSQA